MILKNEYIIPQHLINEAAEYAKLSRTFTSNRHDFHSGGLTNKQKKMFEGKLGEKIFKIFLLENNVAFQEDRSSFTEADNYDFILPDNTTIDVKTRTRNFHIRTLEMVEQFERNPKDIFISIRLYPEQYKGLIIGWFSKEHLLQKNRIENQGYLDNYVMYDSDLHPIKELYDNILVKFK